MATVFEMALEASKDKKKENQFILMMEPKVKKISSRFIQNIKGALEYRDDIENAARVGIHNALMKFDFSYSGFGSYMERAMEMEIRSFLSDSLRTIRMPKYMIESIRKYRNGDECFTEKKKRVIIEAMKTEECISLDSSYSFFDEGKPLCEAMPSYASVEDEYEKKETESFLREALERLDKDEMYVIVSSFGIMDQPKKTNKRVADELGISIGTVSERKRSGLEKLRLSLLAG